MPRSSTVSNTAFGRRRTAVVFLCLALVAGHALAQTGTKAWPRSEPRVLDSALELARLDPEHFATARADVEQQETPGGDEEEDLVEVERGGGYIYPNFSFVALGALAFYVQDDIPLDATADPDSTDFETDSTIVGQIDLLLQSDLTENLSALAQLSAVAEEDEDERFEVEQLQLAYAFSRGFKLRVGKYHTPVGYWNRTFHDIPWLRATIFRPEIYRLEDEGGIMPVHTVGVQASGITGRGALKLSYGLGVGKARNAVVSEAVDLDDVTDADGLSLVLALKRSTGRDAGRKDLQFGISAYLETIPEDPAPAGRKGEIDEQILSAFFVWEVVNFRFIGEYINIRHEDEAGQEFNTSGIYLQSSGLFERWRFYQRSEILEFAGEDPYFAPLDLRDLTQFTAGVRWDPKNWLGLTLEYSLTRREDFPDSNRLGLQLTFNVDSRN